MKLPRDWIDLLESLCSRRVRFLVVGAHALAVHGRPRATGDLDLFVEPTRENAVRLGQALMAFGFPGLAASAQEFSKPDRMATLAKDRRDAATDERSLPQIAASAERSPTGEQEVKLGEDYWGYGRYADAETAARAAMAKGGLKTPWEGPMLLGAAEVAQGKYADAIQTLSQVSGTPAVMRTAHLWSLYAQAKQGSASASAKTAPAQAPSQAPSH